MSYITKQAFANVSGSIPSSLESSENSLSSSTPTINRSIENVDNHSKNSNNRNSSESKTYTNAFDMNEKDLSINLSCHSSNESNNDNEIIEEIIKENDYMEEDYINKSEPYEHEREPERRESKDSESKGTKKFGFKKFRNTISKTFSKASFRKFSVTHRKTMTSTMKSDMVSEQAQEMNFESKEEQEEFSNFINNLTTKNTKKSRNRPSLGGLFIDPSQNPNSDKNSIKSPDVDQLTTPTPTSCHKKNNNENHFQVALGHLCELIDYEDPSVLEKYLKEAYGDENEALKNYLRDAKASRKMKNRSEDSKEVPYDINEMKNIEGNSRKPPVIMDRKSRRIK